MTDANGNLDLFHPGSSTPTQIAPEVTNASGSVIPSFMTAATDGSVVFFTDGDGAALTGNTVSGSGTQPLRVQRREWDDHRPDRRPEPRPG